MSFLDDKTTAEFIAKPATVGAVGAMIAMIMDAKQPVKLLGFNLSPALGFGALSAASVEISEIAHKFIFPHIPFVNKFSNTESAILFPVLSGVSYYGLLRFSDPARVRGIAPTLLAIGSGSAFLGDYLWHHFVQPALYKGIELDDF